MAKNWGGPHPLRVLLDVDVILDVFARREPFFQDSAALLAACETGRCEGMVAAHTVTTLWYLLTKYHDAAYARGRVADVLRIVAVAPVDEDVIRNALTGRLADFEDGVQMAAAAGVEADYVATRNLADFSRGPVPALAPAELLALLDAPPV
jgi:predicted nucleic acid-binding protein